RSSRSAPGRLLPAPAGAAERPRQLAEIPDRFALAARIARDPASLPSLPALRSCPRRFPGRRRAARGAFRPRGLPCGSGAFRGTAMRRGLRRLARQGRVRCRVLRLALEDLGHGPRYARPTGGLALLLAYLIGILGALAGPGLSL